MMTALEVAQSLFDKASALRVEADLLERVAQDIKAEALSLERVSNDTLADLPIADAISGKRHISAKGRAAIRQAQRKRWAAKKAASEKMRKLAKLGAKKRRAALKLEAAGDAN